MRTCTSAPVIEHLHHLAKAVGKAKTNYHNHKIIEFVGQDGPKVPYCSHRISLRALPHPKCNFGDSASILAPRLHEESACIPGSSHRLGATRANLNSDKYDS